MAGSSWILIGALAGGIAKVIMPGRDPGGCIVTILLGIGGAALAGFLGNQLGWYEQGEGAGFIAAVLGAILILFICRLIARPALGSAGRRLHAPRRSRRNVLAAARSGSTIAEPEITPAAPARSASRTCVRARRCRSRAPAAALRPRSAAITSLAKRTSLVRAGDPGPGDAIGVALPCRGDPLQPLRRRVGSGDQHRRDARRAGGGEEGVRLEQRHVGDEDAVDPRLGGRRGRKPRRPAP